MGTPDSNFFSEIVALCSQGILVIDASASDAKIVFCNPAYESVSGYPADELLDSSWLRHAVADDEAPELVAVKRALACGDSATLTLPFLRKDGEIWLGRFSLQPLASSDGRRLFFVEQLSADVQGFDSSEMLKRVLGTARRKLANFDRHDPVSGLLSASEFRLILHRDIAIARRNGQSLHLLLFSIPELETYRETFGDNAADSCLRMIGAQIAGTFRRAGDISARWDESRFAVVVQSQGDEQVRQLVQQVEAKARNLGLHNPRARNERYVVVRGVSVSASTSSDDADSLIERAGDALGNGTQSPALSVVVSNSA